ncbi:Glucosidase 2 subunit beta, partial [Paramuricea clavata]
VLGVSPNRLPLYDPSKDFTCLDGSQLLSFSSVNDDYCDCTDGSDEPELRSFDRVLRWPIRANPSPYKVAPSPYKCVVILWKSNFSVEYCRCSVTESLFSVQICSFSVETRIFTVETRSISVETPQLLRGNA